MRELDFIKWIRSQTKLDPRRVPVGPGDDCAVVRCGGESLLLTTDQVLDGVHFILSRDGPAAAGRKAMARNLSDIAAMAGEPVAALAAVALPKGLSAAACRNLYKGMRDLGEQFGCPVVGGDISTWDKPLAVTITLLGRVKDKAILRSGAKAGDAICVTGALGGAWKTRRHLEFTPRLVEAAALAREFNLHAMIDISDGLAGDLGHLCRESGVGAELVAELVPVHPQAAGLDAALFDGEDYELLFTLPAGQARDLVRWNKLPVPVTCIGTIKAAKGITLLENNRRKKLKPRGWQHET